MRYTIADVYILQHKYQKLENWEDSNVDYFTVDTPEFEKHHRGWQKFGINCWEEPDSALIVLKEVVEKYPEHLFRMVYVHIEKRVIKNLLIT